jgi:hypothetical protein
VARTQPAAPTPALALRSTGHSQIRRAFRGPALLAVILALAVEAAQKPQWVVAHRSIAGSMRIDLRQVLPGTCLFR